MSHSLLISSTRKSSGKTIISIGLSGLANNLGYDIQTFKKGPDFIDPSWLTLASRRPCYNLDFNTMGSEEIKRMYTEKSHGMDFSLIEGTKGLFDGISTDGGDSNAELASLLKSNVLLVIDCEGITRGIAPLLEGYKSFGKKLKLNKVILNNVSTSRHESKLVSAISRYTDFRVLGIIPSIKNFIVERHLGLVPTFQHPQKKRVLSSLVSIIKNNTDYIKNIFYCFKITIYNISTILSSIPTVSRVTIIAIQRRAYNSMKWCSAVFICCINICAVLHK